MTDGTERPSQQIVLQRIHNRILEYLECAASFDDQREYQRKVPFVDVAGEMIEQWADWFDDERLPRYRAPAFSDDEQAAMVEFHRVWSEVVDATPTPLPSLEQTITLPEWHRLRKAAERALAVFRVRGLVSEDDEIVSD